MKNKDFPEYSDLSDKVDLMEAYLAAPSGIIDHFPELYNFVDMVKEDLAAVEKLESSDAELDRDSKIKLRILRTKILTCFNFFENGYHQYVRGALFDSPLDHQYNMSFLGSIRSILRVLNDITRVTLEQCSYPKKWRGFVIFSNTLDFTAAAGSIIVLPFFTRYSVENIQNWLMLSHEIGHIYFWDHPLVYETSLEGDESGRLFASLMDEFFADFYSLERAYLYDISYFCVDYDTVRSRHQDPAESSGVRRYYDIRLIGALLYSCARLSEAFLSRLGAFAYDTNVSSHVIWKFLSENRDSFVDLIRQSCDSLAEEDADVIYRFLDAEFFSGWRDVSGEWYTDPAETSESSVDIEYGILQFIHVMASGEDTSFAKIIQKRENMPPDVYSAAIQQISEGNVVAENIECPFLFLKKFLDHCIAKNILLERESYSHIRAACILSLCSSRIGTS